MINLSFSANEENRIIEMAWEDRTPFEAINYQFSLPESGSHCAHAEAAKKI